MTSTDPVSVGQQTYQDDDLVYVDPETRAVIGRVEWTKTEKPISKGYVPVTQNVPAVAKPKVAKETKGEKRASWRKFYPFGTYRSMKRVFKVEGKIKDPEPNRTLEEVLPKALNEAFWTWK